MQWTPWAILKILNNIKIDYVTTFKELTTLGTLHHHLNLGVACGQIQKRALDWCSYLFYAVSEEMSCRHSALTHTRCGRSNCLFMITQHSSHANYFQLPIRHVQAWLLSNDKTFKLGGDLASYYFHSHRNIILFYICSRLATACESGVLCEGKGNVIIIIISYRSYSYGNAEKLGFLFLMQLILILVAINHFEEDAILWCQGDTYNSL